jgi:hypothetical protein
MAINMNASVVRALARKPHSSDFNSLYARLETLLTIPIGWLIRLAGHRSLGCLLLSLGFLARLIVLVGDGQLALDQADGRGEG